MPRARGWTSSCPTRASEPSPMPGSWRRERMTGAARRARLSPPIAIAAGIALAFLVLPLVALALRAPWGELPRLLASGSVLGALGLSLLTGLVTTALCLVFGVPLAVLLARSSEWAAVPRRLLRAAITVPLV